MSFFGIGIGLGAYGVASQVKAQQQAGKEAKRQADEENALQQQNALMAEREKQAVLEAGAMEERKQRKEGVRLKHARLAVGGKAGVLPMGSFELVQKETSTELEIDALTIRSNTTEDANALQYQADLSRSMGSSALLRGKSARKASRYAALSGGISGAAGLAFMGYGARGKGSSTMKAGTFKKKTGMGMGEFGSKWVNG